MSEQVNQQKQEVAVADDRPSRGKPGAETVPGCGGNLKRPASPSPIASNSKADKKPLKRISPPRRKRSRYMSTKYLEQQKLKKCAKIITELHKKKNSEFASEFYHPLDPVKDDAPFYKHFVTKPMALSTMKIKLREGKYKTAEQFGEDFRLMLRNFYDYYYGVGDHEVLLMGVEVQKIFDRMFKKIVDDSSDEED